MNPRWPVADALRWAGAVSIAAVAVVRCVITFAPKVVFDVDPTVDASPLAGLGPAGSFFLDAVLLAACGVGLLGETLRGRGIDWRLMALALIPVPIAIGHGLGEATDLWRGATWIAAAAACAVVAHLGRDRAVRVVLIALLAAVLVPLVARGATQISVLSWTGPEHARILAEFDASRDAYFADRGWAPDSAAALIYERRLRQADPRGWFSTANLFASLMAFGVILLTGLAIGSFRDRLGRWWRTMLVLAAAVALAALALAGSKGAFGAALAGLALLAAPLAGERGRALCARFGGAAAVALVVAVLLAVVVRGALLPESWLGERSLLFRWHYLAGSAHVFVRDPVVGVGPDGFQAAYTAVRNSRSPEEVASAHNVFADWLSTLGLAGAAWAGLVGLLVWRAGRGGTADPEPARPHRHAILGAAAVVAVLGFMPALTVEAGNLTTTGLEFARALGVVGYVAAAGALSIVMGRLRPAVVDWSLTAAAVALVIHGQIEMTFFDPSSVVWVMCIVGLAGGARARPGRGRGGVVVGGAMIVAAVWVAVFAFRPALHAGTLMIKAATLLGISDDTQGEVQRREGAADLLLAAHADMPTDVIPLEEAARQLMIASTRAGPDERRSLIDRAVTLAEQAANEFGRPTSIALAGEARWIRWRMTRSQQDSQAAIGHAVDLAAIDPHGIASWKRLGDLLWELGVRDEAASAYGRALEADANFGLDPLKQLSERERAVVRERSGWMMGDG